MSMQFTLPPDFEQELAQSLRIIYKDVTEEARRNISLVKEYLTIPEACSLFTVSRKTLEDWFTDGLPLYKLEGRKQYVRKSEVENYIYSHKI